MKDIFRPHFEPAKSIYDAFQDEASKRDGRSVEEWIDKEGKRVWSTARDYAQQNNLRVPTLEEVLNCELSARGHVDYGAKWAYGITELLMGNKS